MIGLLYRASCSKRYIVIVFYKFPLRILASLERNN